MSRKMTFTTTL